MLSIRFTGLWRNPTFVKLWSAQTVSEFGSLLGALRFTAVLVLGATPFQMALLAAADRAPELLIGLIAGVWVDRLRRRPVLIGADIGRAALLGSVPLSFFLGLLRIEQLYLVAFLTGILTSLSNVAHTSYLPSLVRREQLLEANSKLAASSSIVEAGAFSLGGWIVQWFTAMTAVAIDALSFLVSALLVGWIRAPEATPAPRQERSSIRREIAEGLKVVWSDPLLRAIVGGNMANRVGGGMIGTVILLYGIRELGFGPGLLGTIFAVGGISSLFGALVAGLVTRRLGLGTAMIGGFLIDGLAALLIPLAQGPLIVAGAFLVMHQLLADGAATVYYINQMSLRQAIVPDRLLGRVNASIWTATSGAFVVGSLLGGVLGETIGLRLTLLAGACTILLGGLWLALSPVRKLREVPTLPRETGTALV